MNTDTIDKLLSNLKAIAEIPRRRRIKTCTEYITLNEESVFQGFWRWHYRESRVKAVQRICSVVRTLMTISSLLMESKRLDGTANSDDLTLPPRDGLNGVCLEYLRRTYGGLAASNSGIANLCDTYEGDRNVVVPLEALAGEIAAHNALLAEFLNTHGVLFAATWT